LLIQVRKYFCEESICPRKIFAERLSPFIAPFARVTRRLFQIVQLIGLATGGRLGVRVTDRLGIQTSRQTILRRIMALPTKPVGRQPTRKLNWSAEIVEGTTPPQPGKRLLTPRR